ncbi:peptidyl-prolyl cis-trans isomerase FKBP4-like [Babylonia areolata]|uniref:peptidyl-prolyl cis-trans isomerase FKBP4-like n=1 Tax=Babylonia areolata TaxID=304850 RepID=UPI003FD65D77
MAEAKEEPRDVTDAKDGGILLETLKAGVGEEHPCPGDRVTVHYVGTLEDGTKFDSSRDRQEPFQFTIGKGEVIKAWDTGVANMRKNELARITCAPDYAYGERGMPPKIPENATLIFEVELLSWTGQDLTKNKDGGVIKRVLKQGEKVATPNDGATVTIRYTGKHEGRVFEEREVTFTQGEGEEEGIVPGLELATLKMKKEEQNELTLSPKYAYGEKGNPDLGVPPNATLVYDVEMVNFEKVKESWEMDVGEKIEQSKIIKEKGTAAFKKGNYQRALTIYEKIVRFLDHETSGLKGTEPQDRLQLLLAAHLNMAMCYLKLHNLRKAEEACEKALEMDSNNIKALFRRGQSRMERGEFTLATEDFSKVVELEPENKAAKNQIILCRQKEKAAYAKEKALYTSMFKKMAEKSNSGYNQDQGMPEVGEWNNDMAKNMMPLQDERDAFEDGSEGDKKDPILMPVESFDD